MGNDVKPCESLGIVTVAPAKINRRLPNFAEDCRISLKFTDGRLPVRSHRLAPFEKFMVQQSPTRPNEAQRATLLALNP